MPLWGLRQTQNPPEGNFPLFRFSQKFRDKNYKPTLRIEVGSAWEERPPLSWEGRQSKLLPGRDRLKPLTTPALKQLDNDQSPLFYYD